MNFVKSISTAIPPEWDTESSPTTVYHNENVTEIPPWGEGEDAEPLRCEYDQTQYTRQEYTDYRIEKNASDISYLSMMTGVEL